MSIVSMLVCFVFLVVFLFVIPLSIYLFAKLVPNKYPSFIGFPENPASSKDTRTMVDSDDQTVPR